MHAGSVVATMSENRLSKGDAAPDFTAATDEGTFTLSEHRGEHVILYFYPAAMTPGCTTQACDFRDSLSALNAAGYTVVGISKDSPEKLAQFREKEGLTFALVSDEDKAVQELYGAWGEKKLYGRAYMGVIRSAFLIDEKGKIEHAWYKISPKDTPTKLLKALEG